MIETSFKLSLNGEIIRRSLLAHLNGTFLDQSVHSPLPVGRSTKLSQGEHGRAHGKQEMYGERVFRHLWRRPNDDSDLKPDSWYTWGGVRKALMHLKRKTYEDIWKTDTSPLEIMKIQLWIEIIQLHKNYFAGIFKVVHYIIWPTLYSTSSFWCLLTDSREPADHIPLRWAAHQRQVHHHHHNPPHHQADGGRRHRGGGGQGHLPSQGPAERGRGRNDVEEGDTRNRLPNFCPKRT